MTNPVSEQSLPNDGIGGPNSRCNSGDRGQGMTKEEYVAWFNSLTDAEIRQMTEEYESGSDAKAKTRRPAQGLEEGSGQGSDKAALTEAPPTIKATDEAERK